VIRDEAVKREHTNALRELLVYTLAGVKLTKELRRREVVARALCAKNGACRCADGIRKK
jgi:hypothetical protein